MRLLKIFLLFFMTVSSVLASPAFAAQKPVIMVTILPQKYFVEKLVADKADVAVLVSPGADPHSYEPAPSVLKAAGEAGFYFAIGLNIEEVWVPRLTDLNPKMLLFHPASLLAEHAGHAHAHEHGHEHDGSHLWLSPAAMMKIIPELARDLAVLMPEHRALVEGRAEVLMRELEALDADIRASFAPIPAEARRFITFHPAWETFAEDYGLTEICLEYEGKSPGPRRMASIIKTAREHNIKTIFLEPQFPANVAASLAEDIGAEIVGTDPLAEDWEKNLRSFTAVLVKSFAAQR